MRHSLICAMILGALILAAHPAQAAPFLDDFSSDTSGNYVVTDAFGSVGSFDVSSGTLNLTTGASNTVNVFHSTAQLEVGEFVAVDNVARAVHDYYLTISTGTSQPGSVFGSGIRLNVNAPNFIRARVWDEGFNLGNENFNATSENAAGNLTLFISRNTATSFDVAYDPGTGPEILGTINLSGTASVTGLFVGVEAFSSTAGHQFGFDNLRIAPEPSSLALCGFMLALVAVGRARRRFSA